VGGRPRSLCPGSPNHRVKAGGTDAVSRKWTVDGNRLQAGTNFLCTMRRQIDCLHAVLENSLTAQWEWTINGDIFKFEAQVE
jgi:hypothetical protein